MYASLGDLDIIHQKTLTQHNTKGLYAALMPALSVYLKGRGDKSDTSHPS